MAKSCTPPPVYDRIPKTILLIFVSPVKLELSKISAELSLDTFPSPIDAAVTDTSPISPLTDVTAPPPPPL